MKLYNQKPSTDRPTYPVLHKFFPGFVPSALDERPTIRTLLEQFQQFRAKQMGFVWMGMLQLGMIFGATYGIIKR